MLSQATYRVEVDGQPPLDLYLRADDSALVGLGFRPFDEAAAEDSGNGVLARTMKQLRQYFRGERQTFDLPLAPRGTAFQQRVWNALLTIPFGETRSYLEIARQIESPAAVRAVGAANGRNPIAIVIPCHRVIGSNGTLTGFGGGLNVKRMLLDLELGVSRLPILQSTGRG